MYNSGKPVWASLPALNSSTPELNLARLAGAKLQIIYKSGKLGSSTIDKKQMRFYLQETATRYISIKKFANYPEAEHYRARAEALSRAAIGLVAEIEKEPFDDLWSISNKFTSKEKLPLRLSPYATERLSLVSILQRLAAISNDFAKSVRDQPGVKENQELDYLVKRLARLWTLATGRMCPKSLTIHKTGEFTSPAAHFVHEMARAFDPDVTATQIRTVLKRIPPEELSVQ